MTDDSTAGVLTDGAIPIISMQPKGTCRICFEDDGELMAPCRCDGTSKWIHRSCLNKWRVSGTNPRSLTNCCECGFQYELELHRICDLRSEEMRRQFTRQLLSHSALWFLAVQLMIVTLAVIIKLIDVNDVLVKFLPFEKVAKVTGFWPSLQHYAFTYYVAGILVFLMLVGLLVTSISCCGVRAPMDECNVCAEGCSMCVTACSPVDICRCADLPAFGMMQCFEIAFTASGPEMLLIFGAIIIIAILLVGLIAAVAALFMVIWRASQRYVKLQEMGLLAEEYVVKDLAAAKLRQEDKQGPVLQQHMGQGLPPPQLPIHEPSQEEIQKIVEEELRAVFGSALPPPDAGLLRRGNREGYGSTENSTESSRAVV